MKKQLLIVLLIGLIFNMSSAANMSIKSDAKNVQLNKKQSFPSTRAPFISPISLMHYDMELETLFHNDIGVVNIVITDSLGTAVFQDIVDSSEQDQIYIDLSLYKNGDYTINFFFNNTIVYGLFTL